MDVDDGDDDDLMDVDDGDNDDLIDVDDVQIYCRHEYSTSVL
jgi:hypothetical protein